MLCRTWVDENLTSKDLFAYQVWTKFKKKRTERKRSHYEEWEKDVLNYLHKKEDVYIEIKKKDIVENLNIPKRSLDIVLNNLKIKNIIFYKATAGRLGGIKIALMRNLYSYVITLKNKDKEQYIEMLSSYFKTEKNTLYYLIMNYQANNYKIQATIFEEDVGKELIIS